MEVRICAIKFRIVTKYIRGRRTTVVLNFTFGFSKMITNFPKYHEIRELGARKVHLKLIELIRLRWL